MQFEAGELLSKINDPSDLKKAKGRPIRTVKSGITSIYY
jgi:hypothetical protein